MMLRCIECGAEERETAAGWRAMIAEDPEGVEEPEVAIYCPACAEREFGPFGLSWRGKRAS
jgi:hypothetical protein